MAFRFRICKNDTIDWLRDTFQATPLRVPEARVQPLMVVAYQEDKVQFRGELQFLLQYPEHFNLSLQTGKVANVALQRTKKMDISVGMSVLEGFLQGFQMSPASVGLALKGAKEVSFSFSNVERRWVDLGQLGGQLKTNQLDLENPASKIFVSEEPPLLLIVSDVIVCRSFELNIESGNDTSLEASIPAIQKAVADAKLKVKVESKSAQSIAFEGEEFLTFAFSCVRAQLDTTTGAVALMEQINPKSRGTEKSEEDPVATIEKHLLDEVTVKPGFLNWD